MALAIPMVSMPARADELRSLARLSGLLQRAGTSIQVARDCPNHLLGAFVIATNAVVLCANTDPNDPAQIWTVLAHESAHVMQHCRQGYLFGGEQLGLDFIEANRQNPGLFNEIGHYHPSQQRSEIEARLVQGLPPEDVLNLFRRYCSDQLL